MLSNPVIDALQDLDTSTLIAQKLPSLYNKYPDVFHHPDMAFLFNNDPLPSDTDEQISKKIKIARNNFQKLYDITSKGPRHEYSKDGKLIGTNHDLIILDKKASKTGFYSSPFWYLVLAATSITNNEKGKAALSSYSSSTLLDSTSPGNELGEASGIQQHETKANFYNSGAMLGLGADDNDALESEQSIGADKPHKQKRNIRPISSFDFKDGVPEAFYSTKNYVLFELCVLLAPTPELRSSDDSAYDYVAAQQWWLQKRSKNLLLSTAHTALKHTGYYPVGTQDLNKALIGLIKEYIQPAVSVATSTPNFTEEVISDKAISNLLSNSYYSRNLELDYEQIAKLCEKNPDAATSYLIAQTRNIKGVFKQYRRAVYLSDLLQKTMQHKKYNKSVAKVIAENRTLSASLIYKTLYNVFGFKRNSNSVAKEKGLFTTYSVDIAVDLFTSENLTPIGSTVNLNKHTAVNLARDKDYDSANAYLSKKSKSKWFFGSYLLKLLKSTEVFTKEDAKTTKFCPEFCKVVFERGDAKTRAALADKFRADYKLLITLWHTDPEIAKNFYQQTLRSSFKNDKERNVYIGRLISDNTGLSNAIDVIERSKITEVETHVAHTETKQQNTQNQYNVEGKEAAKVDDSQNHNLTIEQPSITFGSSSSTSASSSASVASTSTSVDTITVVSPSSELLTKSVIAASPASSSSNQKPENSNRAAAVVSKLMSIFQSSTIVPSTTVNLQGVKLLLDAYDTANVAVKVARTQQPVNNQQLNTLIQERSAAKQQLEQALQQIDIDNLAQQWTQENCPKEKSTTKRWGLFVLSYLEANRQPSDNNFSKYLVEKFSTITKVNSLKLDKNNLFATSINEALGKPQDWTEKFKEKGGIKLSVITTSKPKQTFDTQPENQANSSTSGISSSAPSSLLVQEKQQPSVKTTLQTTAPNSVDQNSIEKDLLGDSEHRTTASSSSGTSSVKSSESSELSVQQLQQQTIASNSVNQNPTVKDSLGDSEHTTTASSSSGTSSVKSSEPSEILIQQVQQQATASNSVDQNPTEKDLPDDNKQLILDTKKTKTFKKLDFNNKEHAVTALFSNNPELLLAAKSETHQLDNKNVGNDENSSKEHDSNSSSERKSTVANSFADNSVALFAANSLKEDNENYRDPTADSPPAGVIMSEESTLTELDENDRLVFSTPTKPKTQPQNKFY